MDYLDRLRHPVLPASDALWYSLHRNLGRVPIWTFPDVLRGGGLRGIRLTFDNYDDLWPVFADDPSPYIDDRFKTRELLYAYTLMNRGSLPYSGKRGGADWLLIDSPDETETYAAHDSIFSQGPLHLREGQRLIGILHLYALSRERYEGRQPNPFVGLQLISAAHGTGQAAVALGLLERYVQETYSEVSGVTANIDKENLRSRRFFEKQGYAPSDAYDGKAEEFLVKIF